MRFYKFRPHGLYARTAIFFLLPLLLVQASTLAVTGYLVFFPLLRSSVKDLTALMVLSAQTYVELPPGTRPDFVYALKKLHHLDIQATDGPEEGERSYLPYILMLEEEFKNSLDQDASIKMRSTPSRYYWVDLHLAGQWIEIGFAHNRIGTRPPTTILLLFTTIIIITVIATLLITHRLTEPLLAMAKATRQVGYGALPSPLPDSGPREMAILARSFNRMAVRVRELLDTRTTLLAGISHDLRTPLARLRLEVELLRGNADAERLVNMERDLIEMDALIGQLMNTAREVSCGKTETLDLVQLVQAVVADARRTGSDVELYASGDCPHPVNAMAFRRVLANLLDNALAHGRPPVTVQLRCESRQVLVEVLDCGAGIPENQRDNVFRPFTRLTNTPGNGLGLAIVWSIAQTYGWEVKLLARDGGGTAARLQIWKD